MRTIASQSTKLEQRLKPLLAKVESWSILVDPYVDLEILQARQTLSHHFACACPTFDVFILPDSVPRCRRASVGGIVEVYLRDIDVIMRRDLMQEAADALRRLEDEFNLSTKQWQRLCMDLFAYKNQGTVRIEPALVSFVRGRPKALVVVCRPTNPWKS